MSVSDPRTLALHLAARDDRAVDGLFAKRRVPTTAGWADFFDAAEALLQPPLLARGLAALTRAQVAALDAAIAGSIAVAGGPVRDALIADGFVSEAGVPFAAIIAGWPTDAAATTPPTDAAATAAAAPEAPEAPADTPHPDDAPTSDSPLAADDAPVTPAPRESDAAAAERAFAATAALADVLLFALHSPLGRIGSGALGAHERRRLIDAGAVTDAAEADDLVDIALAAGLLDGGERRWLVTETGRDWLGEPTASRWHRVARSLRDALPGTLRTPDGGWTDPRGWAAEHPFDPAWPQRARRLRELWRRWAVIGPDGSPSGWSAAAARGGEADTTALAALLPPEVDRVFLQNDLTAISPGPLAPTLDIRLRGMAVRESRAQASTYRFTSESLSAALAAGETAASMREFLQALSLTGVPQPLAYEIERAATRHGALRVGPDERGRARVDSDDLGLLRTVAVDQALRPVGLVFDGDSLTSRSSPETVYWTLADARYPVVAVDADGRARRPVRHRIAPAATAPAASGYAPLIARLRAGQNTDADAGWLQRELELAVRDRRILTIVVRMPDGSDREVTLEVTGIGGGRLRGLDRSADVERTLPVASILSIRAGG